MEKKDIRLLIVDDSTTIRVLIKKFLELDGFVKIDQAKNGQEAIDALENMDQDEFHMVICDWNMDPVDGLEVLKYIRASENSDINKIPFMMATCEIKRGQVETALKEGANNYVAKPFSRDLFVTKVLDTLSKHLDKL